MASQLRITDRAQAFIRRIFASVLAAAACLGTVGCGAEGRFDGSRSFDENSFRLEYTLLDRREDARLTLSGGDALRVRVAQESGGVDITVCMDGEAPIYEGHALTDIEFVLYIPQPGEYLIRVTGHGARGSVSFVRE